VKERGGHGIIILAILLVFVSKHNLGTSACPIYPMQKKKKNPGHLYLTFFVLCLIKYIEHYA
jgi:hypothetical protein